MLFTQPLHVRQFGQGPCLVFLHGLFGSSDNFQYFIDYFSTSYLVCSFDLRNHGRSFHADQMTFSDMALDVKNTLDALGISSCVLVGHSLGAKVAMQFASDYEHYLNGLVVMDMAAKKYDSVHQPIFEALLSIDLSRHSSRSAVDQYLSTYDCLEDKRIRSFILKNLHFLDGNGTWRFNLNGLANAYLRLCDAPIIQKPLSCPTILIRGGLSDYVLLSDLRLFRQYFLSFSDVEISNAGHWLHADQPQVFIKLLSTFLTSLKL